MGYDRFVRQIFWADLLGGKPHPQGFQTMADVTINIVDKEIPMVKVQELTHIVMGEFQRRGVVITTRPRRLDL